jgi:F-type H+-transporting ATPase subunit a
MKGGIDTRYNMKRCFSIFFLSFVFLLTSSGLNAAENHSHENHEEHEHEEHHAENDNDPVAAIMHHIADAHDFHIVTIGGKHVSLPLPVIVYNTTHKKLDVFLSSKFHHGHDAYNGYELDHGHLKSLDGSSFIDISITKNVFTLFLAATILIIVFFNVAAAYKKRGIAEPKGLQSFIEPIIQFVIDDIAKPNIGPKYEKFLPYLLCVFFFILIHNFIGLVPFFPGSANVSGNIAFTMTLALITFIITNVSGNKHYWQHIFAMPGVPKPVLFILTPVEILGMLIKPIALMVRLFANITAGHVIILSLVSLIFILGENGESVSGAIAGTSIAVPFVLFMNALELLVAVLQAYIFTLLSAIFIGQAVEEHHHEEAHH